MSAENVRLEIGGAIATVTLARPEKLNALTSGMLAQLEASAARLSSVTVGSPAGFSAGDGSRGGCRSLVIVG